MFNVELPICDQHKKCFEVEDEILLMIWPKQCFFPPHTLIPAGSKSVLISNAAKLLSNILHLVCQKIFESDFQKLPPME